MSSTVLVEVTNAAAPLDLLLVQDGVGGIVGQVPLVAIRDATTGQYLDFADNRFKASGWVIKQATMSEVERGRYRRPLNVPALQPQRQEGSALVAEYTVDNGPVKGTANDLLLLVNFQSNLALLRKALTNRMEESPGNPGVLVLFDDNGTTPLLTWYLRDMAGGPVLGTAGAPARRSAAV